MNTSLVGLTKIAVVVFSSTLAAVFVYDRATGGAFFRRLTGPSAGSGDATPVSSARPAVPFDELGADPPQILFSGSKSYSGGTEIVSGSLEITSGGPGENVLVFGGAPDNRPASDTASPETAPPQAAPPTILMSGSKSLLSVPMPATNGPSPAPSPPGTIMYSSKGGPIFIEPSQPAAPQIAPSYPPRPHLPPYANSPAYANVPLTPDELGPRAPLAPPAASAAEPPRPSTLMMGTKSAPVFTPLQPSDVIRQLGQLPSQRARPPTSVPSQPAAPPPADPFGGPRQQTVSQQAAPQSAAPQSAAPRPQAPVHSRNGQVQR